MHTEMIVFVPEQSYSSTSSRHLISLPRNHQSSPGRSLATAPTTSALGRERPRPMTRSRRRRSVEPNSTVCIEPLVAPRAAQLCWLAQSGGLDGCADGARRRKRPRSTETAGPVNSKRIARAHPSMRLYPERAPVDAASFLPSLSADSRESATSSGPLRSSAILGARIEPSAGRISSSTMFAIATPARRARSAGNIAYPPERHLRSASSQAASGCRSGTQARPVLPSDEIASVVTTISSSAGRLAMARSIAGFS